MDILASYLREKKCWKYSYSYKNLLNTLPDCNAIFKMKNKYLANIIDMLKSMKSKDTRICNRIKLSTCIIVP